MSFRLSLQAAHPARSRILDIFYNGFLHFRPQFTDGRKKLLSALMNMIVTQSCTTNHQL